MNILAKSHLVTPLSMSFTCQMPKMDIKIGGCKYKVKFSFVPQPFVFSFSFVLFFSIPPPPPTILYFPLFLFLPPPLPFPFSHCFLVILNQQIFFSWTCNNFLHCLLNNINCRMSDKWVKRPIKKSCHLITL